MEQHELTFQFKARYFKIGKLNSGTKHIWFVLHGYGQLAQYFIRKFAVLEQHNICVIAPEGLSKFYLENIEEGKGRKNNRVGATWMTKENRLTEIENYIEYLNTLYTKEIGNVPIPVTVLGFSQGSATASRWLMNGHAKFDRLILWAGIFPPDMDFENAGSSFRNKDIFMVYGTKDPFLNDSRFAEMETIQNKLGVSVKTITFDGDHNIDEKTLLRFV